LSLINTAIKSGVPSIADLLLRRKRVWINKALLSAIYARKKEKFMFDKTVDLIIRALTFIFWVLIFLAIFIPNSVNYWLPMQQYK